jgi:hypothetical protein
MTITGTSHFDMLRDAVRYYRVYGFNRVEVEQKIKDGEIHLGPPKINEGERYRLDIDNRYIVIFGK